MDVIQQAMPRHGAAESDPREAADSAVAARVRLGAQPCTSADIFGSLAADPVVTVRAAVAMNPATPAHVDWMLATDRDERVRALLARKLATMIPSLPAAERDSVQHKALEALSALIADEAVRVRAVVADAVKDMPEAPRAFILRLAHDSVVAVSDPVLRLSPLLTPQDLLALLAAPPNAATATAVASRPGLPEEVSDAVAAGTDVAAITALLCNSTAAIREATLDALADRSAGVPDWQGPLVRRPCLSARAARALSDIVTSQLLGELARRGDLDPAVTEDLKRRVGARRAASAAPAADPARDGNDLETAMHAAQELLASGRLTEEALMQAVQRGEAARATALLAVSADVTASVVERATTLRSAKGLVSLIWKAGFSMRAAGPVQILLARLDPAVALRATASGGFPLAVEEMRWQIDFLTKMGR